MSTFVDIHVIQSVPPSCVNRDDSGSPKSAVYGGVRRLRVSSQSWKRAVRLYFRDILGVEGLGTRTRRLVDVIASRVVELDPTLESKATKLTAAAINAAADKTGKPIVKLSKDGIISEKETPLFFASPTQIEEMANLIVEQKKVNQNLARTTLSSLNGIDMALFGRMVASAPALNIDAACQVAHAISTHAAENEYDFFTAVDDEKNRSEEEDAGAGMMGTIEFASATMYRYATVNIDLLKTNLGDGQATLRALEAFVSGFCLSMPTGKQSTFANRTLPEMIVVTVREDQPISLVGAFEKAVPADASDGYLGRSIQALARYANSIEDAYGMRPAASFVVSLTDSEDVASLGGRLTFAELLAQLSQVVAPYVMDEELA